MQTCRRYSGDRSLLTNSTIMYVSHLGPSWNYHVIAISKDLEGALALSNGFISDCTDEIDYIALVRCDFGDFPYANSLEGAARQGSYICYPKDHTVKLSTTDLTPLEAVQTAL